MEREKDTAEKAPAILKEAKYDVFISYSRRDYLDENKKPREDSPVWLLWKYLDGHGIKCWIDLEGIYAGSQFAGLIADAIDESKMMIFVSSGHSNSSDWTIGEVLTAHDEGKRIIPFRIDDTPFSKDIRIILRKLEYIDWSPDSEESFASVLKSVEAVKKAEIREHIAQAVRDYSAQAVKLKNLFDDIAKSHRDLGDEHKICPICDNTVSLRSRFCKHCGWLFVPPFTISRGIEPLPSGDPGLIDLMQDIWQRSQSAEDNLKEISSLKDERGVLTSQVNALIGEKTKLEESMKSLEYKNGIYGENEKLLKRKLDELEATEKSLRKRISELVKVQESGRNPSMDASSTHNGHEYVDLGLPSGTLWATCNVGASKPSEYGDYFAWGDTKPKYHYNWDNYVFHGMKLKKSHDASSVNWGGEWRMPTQAEWKELNDNCDSEWTTENGVKGRRFTSKINGNSTFLPAAGMRDDDDSYFCGGRGCYWSSSLRTDYSDGAFYCYFGSGAVGPSS